VISNSIKLKFLSDLTRDVVLEQEVFAETGNVGKHPKTSHFQQRFELIF